MQYFHKAVPVSQHSEMMLLGRLYFLSERDSYKAFMDVFFYTLHLGSKGHSVSFSVFFLVELVHCKFTKSCISQY